MNIDSNTGWLDCARQIASPNCDARPSEHTLDLIVIHSISLPPGEFGSQYIDDLFCNCLDPHVHEYFQAIHTLRVSAHVLIRRSGEMTQYVSFNDRAWHAGESNYQGRSACNDFSVGIELEGADTVPFTEEQYVALAELIRVLCASYSHLTKERVVGHCDIAPGRKTDPGTVFDWQKLERLLV